MPLLTRLFRTVCAASVLTACAVRAGESDLLSEHEFLGEIELTYSASRLPQAAADAPGVVTVLTREMIKAAGVRDLADVFRLVPGFVVGWYNGSSPVVSYHGLSGRYSQHMQVMLDGRSLYTALNGVDWTALPVNLDDIERIEVLRGANSTSYGSNAFLGVVNIITRSALQSPGFYLQASQGNGGLTDVEGRIGSGIGNLNWSAAFGSRQDDGLNGLDDNRKTIYGALNADLRLNNTDDLSFRAGAKENENRTGFPSHITDPVRDEKTASYFGQIDWQRTLSSDHQLSLNYSRTVDTGSDEFHLATQLVDDTRRSTRDILSFNEYFSVIDPLRVSLGAEYRRDDVSAQRRFSTAEHQTSRSLRAYVNLEWKPDPRWTFNLGGLVEKNSLSDVQFAPRAVANWKFTPQQTLRLGYTEAFRTPSLFEERANWRYLYSRDGIPLSIYFQSQGGLSPELNRTGELSYLGEWKDLGLTVDARLFRERITQLITQYSYLLPVGSTRFCTAPNSLLCSTYGYMNAGSADLSGLEYQFQYRPSPRWLWLYGQYFAKRSASTDDLAASIPTSISNILGQWNFSDDSSLSGSYSTSSAIRWIGETDNLSRAHRFNLKLERGVRVSDLRVKLALTGQIVKGETQEFRAGQENGSRVWFSAAFEY